MKKYMYHFWQKRIHDEKINKSNESRKKGLALETLCKAEEGSEVNSK